MTELETQWFLLLDGYARSRHACFLSEFFRDAREEGYVLCFRPLVSQDSAPQQACKYLRLSLEKLKGTPGDPGLVSRLTTIVDNSLAAFALGADPA